MWEKTRPAFRQRRCWDKAGSLALGQLLNFGRHTISRSIGSSGSGDRDWSAMYRLFERSRFEPAKVFDVALKELEKEMDIKTPALAFIDDTLLKKSGRKVDGASWRLDPLGPKFSNNFVWAQRHMQISLACREQNGRCRAIPVSLKHCPTAKKPGRKATESELEEYKKLQKIQRLPLKASESIHDLRNRIDAGRNLIVVGDGGYTNASVCKNLPKNTDYIGRLRKNAALFSPPEQQNQGAGRKRFYGDALPTPEEFRSSNQNDWREVSAATGNGNHAFKIKSYTGIRSKIAGEQNLKMLIVQPLRYRLTSRSRLLYRDPAYIICTNPDIPDKDILQYYLWRWEIELNFKDEKSLLGIHEAQIRTKASSDNFPAFVASVYSIFMLACKKCFGDSHPVSYPKWRTTKTITRPSTASFIAKFRTEVISASIMNKSPFVTQTDKDTKPSFFQPDWKSVINYASY